MKLGQPRMSRDVSQARLLPEFVLYVADRPRDAREVPTIHELVVSVAHDAHDIGPPARQSTRILRVSCGSYATPPIRYTCQPMQKQAWTWTTRRLPQPARMARWGHFGTPVVIFPTAGGDFEEIERFQLIAALGGLIDGGRIKAYSIDGLAVRAWLSATSSRRDCARLQDRYDSFVYEEVLQRIREDCHDDRIEPILSGASLGAFAAISGLCRYPDAFRAAIGL